jgi:hypothetical protein
MSNAIIVANLEALLAAVEAQPETLFDLSFFRNETECGSNFCAVGLACTMPEFQAMGFNLRATANDYSRDGFSYRAEINGALAMWNNRTDFAFGTDSYQRCFEPANEGSLDNELGYEFDRDTDTANMTDKELAVARLKKQIAILKGE